MKVDEVQALAEAIRTGGRQGRRRPGRDGRADADRAVRRRAHPARRARPGTAKTLLAHCFARAVGLDFGRIQFTPDLMPGDILGANLFNFQTSSFTLTRGPIFTELLLADEINRTPPKTQAALLEAMQERQVTIDGETHALGDRFMVVATQNPIEQQGVYPLARGAARPLPVQADASTIPSRRGGAADRRHATAPARARWSRRRGASSAAADRAAIAAAIERVGEVRLVDEIDRLHRRAWSAPPASIARPRDRRLARAPARCWPAPRARAPRSTAATLSSPTTSRRWPCAAPAPPGDPLAGGRDRGPQGRGGRPVDHRRRSRRRVDLSDAHGGARNGSGGAARACLRRRRAGALGDCRSPGHCVSCCALFDAVRGARRQRARGRSARIRLCRRDAGMHGQRGRRRPVRGTHGWRRCVAAGRSRGRRPAAGAAARTGAAPAWLPLEMLRRGSARLRPAVAALDRAARPGLAQSSGRDSEPAFPVLPDLRPVHDDAAPSSFERHALEGMIAQLGRGEGSEFDALVDFRTGMDRRAIDWKQSARHVKLLAKEYRTERNNQIVFAIDSGRQMCEPVAGSAAGRPRVSAMLLTAWVALKLGDRVALHAFDSRPRLASGLVSGGRGLRPSSSGSRRDRLQRRRDQLHVRADHAAAQLTRRSMIVLFTEFTDYVSADFMFARRPPAGRDAPGAGRRASRRGAGGDRRRRARGGRRRHPRGHRRSLCSRSGGGRLPGLQHLGVHVVEGEHDQVGERLVEGYLELKRRDLL